LYIHCTNYYLLAVFSISIAHPSYFNLLFLFFVIVLTLFSSLKRLQKFSLKNLRSSKLRYLQKTLIGIIFFLNFKFNLIIILAFFVKRLGTWGDTIKEWVEVKEGMFAFGCVGLMTMLLKDFMQSRIYLDNVHHVRKKAHLRSRFVGLSESYRVNEEKIYNRVILIAKMSRLAEIEEMFWA
jgi:hypothetical protein